MERQDLSVGVPAPRLPGGPDERRRGRGGTWLDQHVLRRKLEPLLEPRRELRARDDQRSLAGDEPLEAIHRIFGARAWPGEREKLLGILRCAERPEPGAGSARENDGQPHQWLTEA